MTVHRMAPEEAGSVLIALHSSVVAVLETSEPARSDPILSYLLQCYRAPGSLQDNAAKYRIGGFHTKKFCSEPFLFPTDKIYTMHPAYQRIRTAPTIAIDVGKILGFSRIFGCM